MDKSELKYSLKQDKNDYIKSCLIGNKTMYIVDGTLPERSINDFSEVKASFFFTASRLDFDYITRLLKITPTEIQFAKNIKLKEYQKDSWAYSCDYEKSSDINIQVEKVLLPFVGKAKAIKEICEKFDAQVQISVYIESGAINPWIALIGKNIIEMAKLNIDCFDIDIF